MLDVLYRKEFSWTENRVEILCKSGYSLRNWRVVNVEAWARLESKRFKKDLLGLSFKVYLKFRRKIFCYYTPDSPQCKELCSLLLFSENWIILMNLCILEASTYSVVPNINCLAFVRFVGWQLPDCLYPFKEFVTLNRDNHNFYRSICNRYTMTLAGFMTQWSVGLIVFSISSKSIISLGPLFVRLVRRLIGPRMSRKNYSCLVSLTA